jgi:hypothetical protein
MELSLSADTRTTAGILLLTIVAVELLYAGGVCLGAGVVSLGVGLLSSA